MPVEVEAKFRARSPDALAALTSEVTLGTAVLGPPRTIDEVDIYLDTPDGRLAAERWACRLRDRGGEFRLSLKGPEQASRSGSIHRRLELEGPANASHDPSAWPPSGARDQLDRLRGGRALDERLRIRQRRIERPVLLRGEELGTLSLDTATVSHAGEDLGDPLHVVELELHADDPAAVVELERLAEALQARPELEADPRTKLEHALERIAAP
ncbi:MAG: CYTH domain-containing protein [Candidatus Limnocylindria bacterium]